MDPEPPDLFIEADRIVGNGWSAWRDDFSSLRFLARSTARSRCTFADRRGLLQSSDKAGSAVSTGLCDHAINSAKHFIVSILLVRSMRVHYAVLRNGYACCPVVLPTLN
jgi:hypothetical protein